ncbi:MAG: hypothetical protein K8R87_10965, partial [Verrucomicrobia bacterium]|nr:hypothetical protein [Verrucomicrobiota bacterium]
LFNLKTMPAKPHKPDALAIATLAAQFLPRLELPEGWQNMDYIQIREELQRTLRPTQSKMHHATPFELLVETAVERARILLDEARGVEPENAGEIALARLEDYQRRAGNPTPDMAAKAKALAAELSPAGKPVPTALLLEKSVKMAANNPRMTKSVVKAFIDFYTKKYGPFEIETEEINLDVVIIMVQFNWMDYHKEIRHSVLSESGKIGLEKKKTKAVADERNVPSDQTYASMANKKKNLS